MPAEDAKEEIEIRLDGVKVKSVDDLPPELREDVAKRIADARASLAPKYAPGKLRMRINVKSKAFAAARTAAGAAPPPAAPVEEDEGGGKAWLVALLAAALGAAYVFVPGFQDAVSKAVDAAARLRTPAAAPAAPAPSAQPAAADAPAR